MTTVPKLSRIFQILFRLYCLYLQWFSKSNLIYFSSCNFIFLKLVSQSLCPRWRNKIYFFISLFLKVLDVSVMLKTLLYCSLSRYLIFLLLSPGSPLHRDEVQFQLESLSCFLEICRRFLVLLNSSNNSCFS